jgi:titin
MLLASLRRLLARPGRPASRRAALGLEELEGRLAPAVFTVSNINDSGAGSLRQAMLDNNATGPGPNVIDFAVPGAGVHVIRTASALPVVGVPAFIDGASQPGFVQVNAPQIVLDGTNAGLVNGLELAANGCAVRGLVIDHFQNRGVWVQSSGDLLVANYVGTDATGTQAAANLGDDVFIAPTNGSITGNVVQNNLISGSQQNGVYLSNASSGTVLAGNLIGTDITGTRPLGNLFGIFDVGSSGNRLGGNVISGNQAIAALLGGSGEVIANNLIGTDATGTRAVPNGDGVSLEGTADMLIANVISGNRGGGVALQVQTSRNLVLGNLVGVDLSGERPLGNSGNGIDVDASTNGVVAGNTVAANAGDGIVLNGNLPVSGNVVVGNRVGTDASGTVALGNGGRAGVEFSLGASNNLLDANLIAGNRMDGVYLHDSGDTGNRVQRNFIGLTTAGAPLPNGLHGVEIAGAAGGNTVFANAVLFNRGHGIVLHDIGTSGEMVLGNNSSFNAGAGVLLANGAANNSIGGSGPGQGNTLAFNGQAGVWADGGVCTGELISGNAIFGNTGLGGIALTHAANANPVAPVLLYALSTGSGPTAVVGTLHAAANTAYTLEFFDSPSGGGQGQTFLGSVPVDTDGSGNAAFSADFGGALTSVTATATSFISTSAFSAPVAVVRL